LLKGIQQNVCDSLSGTVTGFAQTEENTQELQSQQPVPGHNPNWLIFQFKT